jgi:HD-like signal output (HDOD) protein
MGCHLCLVEKGITLDVAEHIVLGTNHAEVGAHILKQWSFPEDLVNAVGWHHNPESCENLCMLSDIVHIANGLGQMIGAGRNHENFCPELSLPLLTKLGFKPEHLEVIANQTSEGLEKFAEAL